MSTLFGFFSRKPVGQGVSNNKNIERLKTEAQRIDSFTKLPQNDKPKQDKKDETIPKTKHQKTMLLHVVQTVAAVTQEMTQITKELEKHRQAVHGIALSAKAEKESIEIFRKTVHEFLAAGTCGENTCSITHDRIKELFNGTDSLLESIHGSILCQSKTLEVSYKNVTHSIHNTLDFIRSHQDGLNGQIDEHNATIGMFATSGRKSSLLSDNDDHISEETTGLTKDVSECKTALKNDDQNEIEGVLLKSESVSEENDKLQETINTDSDNLLLQEKMKQLEEEHQKVLMDLKTEKHKEHMEMDEKHKEHMEMDEKHKEHMEMDEKHKEHMEMDEKHKEHMEMDEKHKEHMEMESKLQIELDEYKRRCDDLQKQIRNVESTNDNLIKTNEKQLALLEKQNDQIQLHYEGKGDLILKAIDELKSRLSLHMGKQRHELKFIHCPTIDDVDPDIPLMVICINVSRIGTDVQRTLRHLNASNKVALLILHHKDVHALPSQASERVLTGVDFQSLGGIFDLAFLAEKGLYQCDMNSKAVEGIVNFIKII